ncbi:hypothetical protein GC169_12190 [bacterium]|nr:hypothetical protein [bacterium]
MSTPRRSPSVYLIVALACTIATACSQGEQGVVAGPEGNPVISLSEGACMGTCPVYDMTLRPDGAFILHGQRFVRSTGVSEGALGPDAWSEAEAVLVRADFWKMRKTQTPETLPNCVTDAPTALITWRTPEGKEKTVTYDAGCDMPKTRQMVADLRRALGFDTLVWTDERFVPPAPDSR